MKKGKKAKLVKGTSPAVLVSALIHGVLLLGAGVFVVFHIVDKKEAQFVPPTKIERPKMNLKKPRVKVKKTSRPRSTQRIVSKNVAAMPNIQLPDVSTAGSGLSGGVDGYELVPDVEQLSVFGGARSMATGNDLEGTFYSLAYDRRGRETEQDDLSMMRVIRRFVESDWNPFVFAPYYRAPQKLYTTQILIPPIATEFGPSSFGIPSGPDFDPYLWCVHYKGRIMRKEGGRFRFWGLGDEVLLVRVDGKLVLNATWEYYRDDCSDWEPQDEDYKYHIGNAQIAPGLWFELEPGVPVEIEVLIGEGVVMGGQFCAYLLVEEEGEMYGKNQEGMPVFPVFKTSEIPERVKDKIKYSLIPGEGDLDSELMFNVY